MAVGGVGAVDIISFFNFSGARERRPSGKDGSLSDTGENALDPLVGQVFKEYATNPKKAFRSSYVVTNSELRTVTEGNMVTIDIIASGSGKN